MSGNFRRLAATGFVLGLLASCGPNGGFDPDLRGWMPGNLATDDAAAAAPARPEPDQRGVITFANGQVAVARAGDTPSAIAARLGLGAAELARHNALMPDTVLEAGAVLVLPSRVAGAPAGGAAGAGGVAAVTDPFANQPSRSTAPTGTPPAAAPAATPAASPTAAPREHV
ncbi:LysM peptidoglycan-binding domain-containing protein, partial [Paracoccus sp. (in: a-proteobacteria)]|uniref:LysM peptidoglycan-binding domain-containing protein n=1 Tax=Paracoccus sp. TaxID=267 RepID=UPI00272967D2